MEQPISLYLDLEEGQHADLEVVARASIAFAKAVREIAYVVDPSLEIRLQFESGTEGSLSLNSLVKYARDKIPDPLTRGAIVGGVLGFFSKEVVSALVGLLVQEAVVNPATMSDAEVTRVATEISRLLESRVAEDEIRTVFREIERDSAIKGVGITTVKGARPRSLVPRSEFRDRSGSGLIEEVIGSRRVRVEPTSVILISPILQVNDRKKWRFLSPEGPISAAIKNKGFLERVLSGRSPLQMVSGIEMDVLLETREKRQDGVWQVTERNVLEVYDARRSSQYQLDLSTDEGQSENDED